MAATTAPLLDAAGSKAKDVTLADGVFDVEVKPHLVHEAVRAEQNLLLVKGAVPGHKNGVVEIREEKSHGKR